ncbi:hypothetical protein [Agromyces sp. M3QZ16-3]|uniref:hypothetical protein n=1 Tax=Agromyces sp. M3QZ16-3 TaxID=3447585 RepID=UPI003F68ED6D
MREPGETVEVRASMTDMTTCDAEPRPLTELERSVLARLLSVDFDGVAALREQARQAMVLGMCVCGCPSIDFTKVRGRGMIVRVDAAIRGTNDSVFLYTIREKDGLELLGGIEYTGYGATLPGQLPAPDRISLAGMRR